MLERLAEAAHEVYCEGEIARGVKYGPETDKILKTNNALLPYTELTEEMKEQNRQNVRDIPDKLAVAGYIMIPARSNERPFEFPDGSLEVLSIAEHERFVRSKLDEGWIYDAKEDRAKKQRKDLVPWKELPEEEKMKDYDLVRGIPTILARAGYAIRKLGK